MSTPDPTAETLLTVQTAESYVRRRGSALPSGDAMVQLLGGGVSNVVILVSTAGGRVVVKQSLPRLNVAEEWLAKRERVLTEAAALQVAQAITPGSVPPVLDVDHASCAITIQAAPATCTTWKAQLIDGIVDTDVARRLGVLLASWHAQSALRRHELLPCFNDRVAFDQLRIDPYHRTVAARQPDLAPAIGVVIATMDTRRWCLVHGDFSPKNVLVDDGLLWVIDFEVAHFGDPTFDLAFLLCHLLLKSVHRPENAVDYRASAHTFLDTYRSGVPDAMQPAGGYLSSQVGCLLAARAVGKSPAEYLTPSQTEKALSLGRTLLLNPPIDPLEAWPRLLHV